MFLQEGDVLLKKLLLKRFRCRRDDYSPPAANRRNQIREGLAGSCSRLDHHVLVFLKRIIRDLRHFELRRPELIPRVALLK